ncbi:hypothetical protein KR038_006938 [Drosophila bunnanda]|nr:hypothetical protein KR038_006938 [Drosophila bunnanda]
MADKVIHLDQITPWCPIQPATVNESQNKLVSDKQKFQSNERVNTGRKRSILGIIQPQNSNGLSTLSYTRSAPVRQPPAVGAPRGVLKIYPRPNMPVKSQSMQHQTKYMIIPLVDTTKNPAASSNRSITGGTLPLQRQSLGINNVSGSSSSLGARQDQRAASSKASVPSFGYIFANKLPAYPARIQGSNFIIKIPDVETLLFKSLEDINRFLNNHLSTNAEFKGRVPAEWKFLMQK